MIELHNGAVLNALGWACIHLLWQALLLAGVLRLYSSTVATGNARARYAAALLTVVLLAIVAAATVWLHLPKPIAVDVLQSAPSGPGQQVSAAASLLAVALPIVGVSWLIVTTVFVLRLALALVAVRRTRRRSAAVDPVLDAMCARLALQAAPGRKVVLRTSNDVTAPCVLGATNATILLPRKLAATIAHTEVRALLAHELAHVRRRDYIVNVALRVLSLPLVWHPAVRWLLRRIEYERELCCDDEAAALCSDRTGYARALAHLALVAPGYNMAMGAATTSLAERIRRLSRTEQAASFPPPRRGAPAFAALAAALLIAMSAFAVPMSITAADKTNRSAVLRQLVRFNATDSAGAFTLDVVAGRAYHATMNGIPLPPARLRQNGPIVTLVGEQPAETVQLFLSAPASIRWTARTPSTH